jgi:hypothetical protein
MKNQSEPGMGDREKSDAAREQHDGLRRQLGSVLGRCASNHELLVLAKSGHLTRKCAEMRQAVFSARILRIHRALF